MYRRFRWTPNNTPGILFWGFGVPIFAFFAFAKTNVRASLLANEVEPLGLYRQGS